MPDRSSRFAADDINETRKAHRSVRVAARPGSRFNAIAEVARVADPDDPGSVSQRRWDSARATAGYAEAPSARQMCQALKVSWSDALRIALDDNRSLTQTVAGLTKTEERKWTEREVHYALHLVARELDANTFSSLDYTRTRERLIRRDRGRNGKQAILERLLPTTRQLLASVGDGAGWNEPLVAHGLEPFEQDRTKRTALTVGEAYDLFIELTHDKAAATLTHLNYLRARHEISIERISQLGDWPSVERRLIELRKERGLKTPRTRLTKEELKALVVPDDVLDTLPRSKRKMRWTYEKCVIALAEYLRELPADTAPSQHHYQTVCGEHGWPAGSTIIRKAPWSVMLDAARVCLLTGEIVPLGTAMRSSDRKRSK